MDFFEHQERARRKTGWLILYFAFAVIGIIITIYAVAIGGITFSESRTDDVGSFGFWHPDIFAGVALGTLAIISLGSLYKIAQLARGGEVVAIQLGGRPVLPSTRDLAEKILLNVIEEMAIAAGTPVPPVYLLDHEHAINAFAAGTTPQNAVIGVTRGAIETLKRDELQGVIAHEFSHILNGDMRINIRMMGILNGILIIATIGYILMRTGGGRNYRLGNSDTKKGGNPLPIIGLCLYIIGYIGVFFGHLIKSAVSRQREFLADASAVQFTRYPSGIAGALKKIGGLSAGSKLETANAEEASHMYFGNGLSASFLSLMATHPPLPNRIRRIDPSFDGVFPETTLVDHREAELIDPTTLAQLRSAESAAHSSAVAGAEHIAFAPDAAVAQVGTPNTGHMNYAATLVRGLPTELRGDVRDPLGAIATIYALLLDDDEPEVQVAQRAYLKEHADPRAYAETERIAPFVARVQSESKLPLVSMVLPALHELSPKQVAAFHADVNWLIKADRKISLFEYGVHRLILKRLIPRLEGRKPQPARISELAPLLPACQGLMSALAYSAGEDNIAQESFRQGSARLVGNDSTLRLLRREDATLRVVDDALDKLVRATPPLKKRILEGCAECIGADGHVTVEEGEFLRAIADALECPMPPLIGQERKGKGI